MPKKSSHRQKKNKKRPSKKGSNVSDLNPMVWRRKYMEAEGKVGRKIMGFLKQFPDCHELMSEAAMEFYYWREDVPESFADLDYGAIFMPWFLYSWLPSPDEDGGEIEDEFEEEEDDDDDDDDYYYYDYEDDDDDDDDIGVPVPPLAAMYLFLHEDKVRDIEKRFILEAMNQPFSLLSVVDVQPGRSMKLRDILREKDYVVMEQSASRAEFRGSVLLGRVLCFQEVSLLFGVASRVLPAAAHPELISFREDVKAKNDLGLLEDNDLFDLELVIRGLFYSYLESFENMPLPSFVNTSGHEMKPNRLRYELCCLPEKAFGLLAPLCIISTPEKLLEEAEFDTDGKLKKVNFTWFVEGNEQHKSWQNTMFANIDIDGSRLQFSTNSLERSRRVKAEMKSLLGGNAIYKDQEIDSIEEMLEKQSDVVSSSEEKINISENPEIKKLMQEMVANHYREWLDSEIPVLDNLTPRQAAKTSLGREKLGALLVEMELRGSQLGSSYGMSFDVNDIRRELKLDVKVGNI